MSDTASTLAEHYQKTYELTHEMWKQRNNLFLYLVATIGGAAVLTYRLPEANSLLVDLIARLVGIDDASRISQLYNSFPFGVLQSILLIVIFYQMVNLYHRALYVLRSYQYLAGMEDEIRAALKLPAGSVAFTREGAFYWKDRSRGQGTVKWSYILLLGVLLFSFLLRRIAEDVGSGNTILALAETALAVPIIGYYLAYAAASVGWDKPAAKTHAEDTT